MSKLFTVIAVSLTILAGCSVAKPRIISIDNVPNESVRQSILESVEVVWDDEALRFDDPSVPSPLQIVVPRRSVNSFWELFSRPEYKLRLFYDNPVRRLTIISAITGTQEQCGMRSNKYGYDDYLDQLENGMAIKCGDSIYRVDNQSEIQSLMKIGEAYGEVESEGSKGGMEPRNYLIRYISTQRRSK